MTDDLDFMDGLEEDNPRDHVAKATNPKYARKTYTCEGCNGRGTFKGGNNAYKCNMCHGRGTLVTDPASRAKARASNRKLQGKRNEEAQAVNAKVGDGFLLQWLKEVQSWNSFAASLIDQHNRGKIWSEKQIAASRKMYLKWKETNAKKAEAKAERLGAAPAVDLRPIRKMFDEVIAKGFKRPMYRADGLRIKPGKDGSLYVLTEDRMEHGYYGEQPGYEGKISDNRFFAAREAAPETTDKLKDIAEDPLGAAVRYGNATGRCACCGRELTKHESIARGIGPTCAERWGLWGQQANPTKEQAKAKLDELKTEILN